jgi:hypothetical protein
MVRSLLVGLLLLVLVLAAMAANATTWAARTVLDDQAFASTVGRTLDTPALEAAVSDALTDAATDRILAIDPTLRAIGAGVLGLEPTADAREIHAWVAERMRGAIRSDGFEAARDRLVLAVHRALVGRPDPYDIVRLEGDAVVVDLAGLSDATIAGLDAEAPRLVRLVPVEASFVVARADELETIQTTLATLRAVQVIVPLVVVLTILLILVLAHRRVRALGAVGVALVAAGVFSLVATWVAGSVAAARMTEPLAAEVAGDVVDAMTATLATQSLLLIAGGAVFMLLAMLVGGVRGRRAPRGPR